MHDHILLCMQDNPLIQRVGGINFYQEDLDSIVNPRGWLTDYVNVPV